MVCFQHAALSDEGVRQDLIIIGPEVVNELRGTSGLFSLNTHNLKKLSVTVIFVDRTQDWNLQIVS